MKQIKPKLFITTLLATILLTVMLTSKIHANSTQAVSRINEARAKNNLPLLKHMPTLDRAAYNHNLYMARNQTCDHIEEEGLPNFTGTTPWNRSKSQLYAYLGVSENLTCGGDDSWQSSVSELMSAIYHRIAFLRFGIDEIGLSHIKGDRNDQSGVNKFSYVMGNSNMRQMCEAKQNQTPLLNLRSYYKGQCIDEDIMIDANEYDQQKNKLYYQSPKIVIYPWNQQTDVYPAFLDNEVPDPTPTLELSGMPISVQFNPVFFNKPIRSVSLTVQDTSGSAVNLWMLEKQNDIHQKMSRFEYAWFPIRPLAWGTAYTVKLQFETGGEFHEKTWHFKTKNMPKNVVASISEENNTVLAPEGQRVGVHCGNNESVIKSISCRCTACKPKIDSFDIVSLVVSKNSIPCKITRKDSSELNFTLSPA